MATAAIGGARIFDGAAWHEGRSLLVADGKIVSIAPEGEIPADADRLEAGGLIVVPGFVDLQVNGGGGVLLNEAPTADGIATICAAHARFGTTALLATLITDTPMVTERAIEAGRQARADGVAGFLGLHLEGPHLSLARKGAHDPSLIRPMEDDDLARMVEAKSGLDVLMSTVAPENATTQQVAALASAGVVVSLGHSDSACATVLAYADAGARCVTHLFNAMSPLGHREPGMVGAALATGALSAGLIADGFHVDPVAIGVALRAKAGPGRIFLVTDAMSTIGTDIGEFTLNGRTILRRNGRLTLADGTLAGADIDMLSSVRFLVDKVGITPEEALRMASLHPAEAVGISDRKGQLRAGSDADFVLLTPDLRMHSTWIGGERVFGAGDAV